MESFKTDVLVVGSGPAGSMTARYAAMKGAQVTVIERRSTVGVPVRCGEFMPDTENIRTMFPLAEDIEGLFDSIPSNLRLMNTKAIRLVNPKGKTTDLPVTGYTTDRDRFDQYLAGEAQKEGAEIVMNCRFDGIEDGVAKTSMGDIEYKVIVGADGPGSRVAQSLGLKRNRNPYPAFTAQAKGDFEPYVMMYFGGIAPGAYSWIMPKKGQANIGVGFSPKFAKGRKLSDYFDKFVERENLNVVTRTEGKYVPSEGPIDNTVSGNGMVVGDAAGHVISVNGGGIPLAMIAGRICGQVAGDNILNGRPLEDYQTEWRRVMLKPLKTAAFNKKLADIFAFHTEWTTSLCMAILGKRRMTNLIQCRRIFP
jgi:digeranylgeranylglycerophospholipid reductase